MAGIDLMARPWYEVFFGKDYYRTDRHADTSLEIDGITALAGPSEDTAILDLACGYGRHGAGLAKAGYRVVGLDLSEMLLRCGPEPGRGVSRVRGDMRSLPFREAFDVVINMFTAFGYFEEETENFHVLREIEAVLRPGGRFICQLVNRDFLVRSFLPQEIRREDGLLIIEERSFDAVGSRVLTTTTIIEGDVRRRYRSSIRVYTAAELGMLLAAAGLQVGAVYGGLDRRPYDWTTNQLVIVADKPKTPAS